ncbi:MAG: hypothetical protein EOO61_07215 [Hymenobacter sp.]|nr:MAG: hypothetical protein EOO61_07215 [Hymenobacter sp.]
MRTSLRLLLILILLGSCAWWLKEGGFEPALAAGGALVTLLEDSRTHESSGPTIVKLRQSGKNSTMYQSNGNMYFGNHSDNVNKNAKR